MRLLYLTYDGWAKVEKTRSIMTRLIEMPDGDHVYTNDSVWQDAQRFLPPIVIMQQNTRDPYGAVLADKDAEQILFEAKLAEINFRTPSESKMWQRQIQRIFDWISQNLIILFVIIIAAFGIYQVAVGGT